MGFIGREQFTKLTEDWRLRVRKQAPPRQADSQAEESTGTF